RAAHFVHGRYQSVSDNRERDWIEAIHSSLCPQEEVADGIDARAVVWEYWDRCGRFLNDRWPTNAISGVKVITGVHGALAVDFAAAMANGSTSRSCRTGPGGARSKLPPRRSVKHRDSANPVGDYLDRIR